MSKKSKKNRVPRDKTPKFEFKKPSKQEPIGPFTVIADVFGPKFDHRTGQPTSHVDPKSRVRITTYGRAVRDGGSVQEALGKLRPDKKSPEPFYQIVSVIDHGKIALNAALENVLTVEDLTDSKSDYPVLDELREAPEFVPEKLLGSDDNPLHPESPEGRAFERETINA